MHVPYPGSHHLIGGPPMLPIGVPPIPSGGIRHYPGHPSYPPTHHQPIAPPHVQPNRLNGFHVAHFEAANVPSLHHPGTAFAATSTSTLIAHHHHQATAQSTPSSLTPALSKDEFYMKQRYLQRM
jgi:hypothetical protein